MYTGKEINNDTLLGSYLALWLRSSAFAPELQRSLIWIQSRPEKQTNKQKKKNKIKQNNKHFQALTFLQLLQLLHVAAMISSLSFFLPQFKWISFRMYIITLIISWVSFRTPNWPGCQLALWLSGRTIVPELHQARQERKTFQALIATPSVAVFL